VNKSNSGIIHIWLILILLVVGAVGAALLSRPGENKLVTTPDPTANWQTYTNIEYKFSIMYPPSFTPKQHPDNDTYLSLTSFSDNSSTDTISVEVREANLKDQVALIKWTNEHSINSLISETDLKISGFPAKRLDYTAIEKGIDKPRSTIVVYNGKYSYSIHTTTDLINKVISTFQFTGPPLEGEFIEEKTSGLTAKEASQVVPLTSKIKLTAKTSSSGIALTWTASQTYDYLDVYRRIPTTEGWGQRLERFDANQQTYEYFDENIVSSETYSYQILSVQTSGKYEIIQDASNTVSATPQ